MSTSSTSHRPGAKADIDLTGDLAVDTSTQPFEGGPDGPLQTIRISGVTFSEREVEVVVRDGIAYFEGVIRLGPAGAQPTAGDPGEKAVIVTGTGVRWPNAVIPYVIDGR